MGQLEATLYSHDVKPRTHTEGSTGSNTAKTVELTANCIFSKKDQLLGGAVTLFYLQNTLIPGLNANVKQLVQFNLFLVFFYAPAKSKCSMRDIETAQSA